MERWFWFNLKLNIIKIRCSLAKALVTNAWHVHWGDREDETFMGGVRWTWTTWCVTEGTFNSCFAWNKHHDRVDQNNMDAVDSWHVYSVPKDKCCDLHTWQDVQIGTPTWNILLFTFAWVLHDVSWRRVSVDVQCGVHGLEQHSNAPGHRRAGGCSGVWRATTDAQTSTARVPSMQSRCKDMVRLWTKKIYGNLLSCFLFFDIFWWFWQGTWLILARIGFPMCIQQQTQNMCFLGSQVTLWLFAWAWFWLASWSV